jgi:hypothetical protein
MAMNMESSPQLDDACNICRRTIGKIAVMAGIGGKAASAIPSLRGLA